MTKVHRQLLTYEQVMALFKQGWYDENKIFVQLSTGRIISVKDLGKLPTATWRRLKYFVKK